LAAAANFLARGQRPQHSLQLLMLSQLQIFLPFTSIGWPSLLDWGLQRLQQQQLLNGVGNYYKLILVLFSFLETPPDLAATYGWAAVLVTNQRLVAASFFHPAKL